MFVSDLNEYDAAVATSKIWLQLACGNYFIILKSIIIILANDNAEKENDSDGHNNHKYDFDDNFGENENDNVINNNVT